MNGIEEVDVMPILKSSATHKNFSQPNQQEYPQVFIIVY